MQLVVKVLVDLVLLVLDLALVEKVLARLEVGQTISRAVTDQQGHRGRDLLVAGRQQGLAVGQHVEQTLGRAIAVDEGVVVVLGDLLGVAGDELCGEVGGDLERGCDLGDGAGKGDGEAVGAGGARGQDQRSRGNEAGELCAQWSDAVVVQDQ